MIIIFVVNYVVEEDYDDDDDDDDDEDEDVVDLLAIVSNAYAVCSTYDDYCEDDDDDKDDDDENNQIYLLTTMSNAYAVLLSLVDWGSVVYQPCLQISTGIDMIVIRTLMMIIRFINNEKSCGQ